MLALINRLYSEWFIFFVLKSKEERRLAIASGLFGFGSCIAGVYSNLFNFTNGVLFTGGASTAFFLAKIAQRSRKLTDYVIEEYPKLTASIENSTPCQMLKDAGFEVVKSPVRHEGSFEFILRSFSVDAYLRAGGPVLEEASPSKRLQHRLEDHADSLEKLLRCKVVSSNLQKKKFINETKVTLLSDPIYKDHPLLIAKGSYYRSYLTNDWAGMQLVTCGSYPSVIDSGFSWFPTAKMETGEIEVVGIEDAPLGNHLGVSTIAITRDRKLVLWRQSRLAQHSPRLLAPTGSGSVDWKDYESLPKPRTLTELAKYAMERELTEESFGGERRIGREHIVDTRVLGYFRWLRRGGLPQCVGVTRMRIDAHELSPDIREVDHPEALTLLLHLPASNRLQLQDSVTKLLGHELLSLPLFVTLETLIKALDSKETELEDFLFGQL